MADEVDKKPIEAPSDNIATDEADQALAAMGYNPVSPLYINFLFYS